jgi:hypothetical protein
MKNSKKTHFIGSFISNFTRCWKTQISERGRKQALIERHTSLPTDVSGLIMEFDVIDKKHRIKEDKPNLQSSSFFRAGSYIALPSERIFPRKISQISFR